MKPYYEENGIKIHCQDCMEAMKEMKDNEYSLAITDPPYNANDAIGLTNGKAHCANRKKYHVFKNEMPPDEYFIELKRVSKNQIIWGGNFFGLKGGYICWNKEGTAFGQAELAYCSMFMSVRICRIVWNGMIQHDMKHKEFRIHPTQKPVALYKWLLKNYAKKGDRILDTHLGSGSSAIAAYDMGFEFTGYEIDKDYCKAAVERIKRHMSQGVLPLETPRVHNSTLPLDNQCEIVENEA